MPEGDAISRDVPKGDIANYSITSSATVSILSGMVRPSAFAVSILGILTWLLR
jgi:hypothetical protein